MVRNAQSLCVAQVPLFAGLADDELFEVADRARPLRRRAGETIHRPGEDLSHLLVVHHGQVRISALDTSGTSRLVRTLEGGDFIGEAAFVTGSRPDHFATAMTDVELCSFSHSDLQGLVDQFPAIAVQMLRTVTARLDSAERFIAELTTAPVATRLARYLIELPASRSNGSVTLRFPIAKKDVASLLGMTPETLSRQLAAFSMAGLIEVHGRDVIVLDESGLDAQATPHARIA